jgi:hypothetical protein
MAAFDVSVVLDPALLAPTRAKLFYLTQEFQLDEATALLERLPGAPTATSEILVAQDSFTWLMAQEWMDERQPGVDMERRVRASGREGWGRGQEAGSCGPVSPVGSYDRLWRLGLELALDSDDGLVLEFGVYKGKSITAIANWLIDEAAITSSTTKLVHGFDSFEGLPEAWARDPARFKKGAFSTQGVLPDVPDNVRLHRGWYESTVKTFIKQLSTEQREAGVQFLHMDSDLYTSTLGVLSSLHAAGLLRRGTVLLFDDFLNFPGWRDSEAKAFFEVLSTLASTSQLKSEYVAFCTTRLLVRLR